MADALTLRQRRFVSALLTARTIEEAAQAAGIARRTAFNYLKKSAVRQEIAHLVDEAMRHAMRRAVCGMAGALDTLEEIHGDTEAPAGARVSASRAVLENAARLKGDIDIMERLAALEEAYNARERERTATGRA